jgi:hypothetical protein
MSPVTMCMECECGEVIEVTLHDGDICQYEGTPLTDHKLKHAPQKVTFMCLCGARHATGPAVYETCDEGMKELRKWWGEHRQHVVDNVAN